VTLKGLPLAYNRDLQGDKEPLFDSLDRIRLAVGAVTGMIRALTFNAPVMQAAADTPFVAATDLAEHLVENGMPFREAHAIVGSLVRNAVDRHVDFGELVENHPALGPKALTLLEPGSAVARRTTPGGGGPGPVAAQLTRFEASLARMQARMENERLGDRRVSAIGT
jgi:argininosuccinate lyase